MKQKKLRLNRIFQILLFCFFTIILFACKKNNDPIDEDTIGIDKSKTYLSNEYENNLRDSVWYYYKTLSIWQDAIPPTKQFDYQKIDEKGFIRNTYTKYFERAENVLDYLKRLTKERPGIRSMPLDYDWYSILDRGGAVAAEVQNGISFGFGMSLIYLQGASSNNADLYVRYVENGSAAKQVGIARGDQILAINGDVNLDYNYQKQREFAPLLGYLNLYSITIKYKEASSGDIIEKSLNYSYYGGSPILVNKVLSVGDKKIGYLLFNSFASIIYSHSYTSFYYELNNAFSEFQRQGINELVLDLRYNGGGDVETSEFIANWIAPSIETGNIMYSYEVNKTIPTLSWIKENEFAPIKFKKNGNISLSRVYFLVSPYTASASELLINSLKPVMNTYMVGTYSVNDKNVDVADRTYGKPVGFFGLDVMDDNVNLYVASFKMINSKGEGDYYDGFEPNVNVWEFRNFKNFGDPEESMLASAISHMQTGTFGNNVLKANTGKAGVDKVIKSKISFDLIQDRKNFGMYKFKKLDNRNN